MSFRIFMEEKEQIEQKKQVMKIHLPELLEVLSGLFANHTYRQIFPSHAQSGVFNFLKYLGLPTAILEADVMAKHTLDYVR